MYNILKLTSTWYQQYQFSQFINALHSMRIHVVRKNLLTAQHSGNKGHSHVVSNMSKEEHAKDIQDVCH